MDTLGKRLKFLREKNNYSQKRVADAIGLTNVQLSRYESGDRNPDPTTINLLADFFDVSTDYLLGRTDDPHLLKENEEFERFKNNPELERWFKQLPENDEEDLLALKDMWEIIKRNKKK